MGVEFIHAGDTLTTVRRSSVRLQEVAEMGRVGQGTVVIENSAGTLEIIGHKPFRVNEDDCADPKILRGFMGDRGYKRDMMRTGGERVIEPNVYDLNAKFGFKVIRGREWRKRPKNDTIATRLADLLASGFLGLIDAGHVTYPDIALERTDLRGQRPGDLLTDMATRAGFNFFAYWDDGEDAAALWFQDSNTSTEWSSTLRISNVIADIDTATVANFGTGTTFAASQDTELRRSPAQVVSGVWMPFKKGNVYRTRAATEAEFEPRDGTAPNANVRKRSRARNIADRFLNHHKTEEDRITTTIQVPSSKVNLVRAGMRLECKFSDYATEGYGSFTWMRVVDRTISIPTAPDHDRYNLTLTLSPQEGTSSSECVEVDLNATFGTVAADHDRHEWNHVVAFPGADGAFFEFDMFGPPVTNLNDDDEATHTGIRNGVVINASNQFKSVIYTDLGSAHEATRHLLTGDNFLDDIVHMNFESSDDGAVWTPITGTASTETIGPVEYWVFTFDAPVTARYFSLVLEHVGVSFDGIDLSTWEIRGCEEEA
jgi:hypothetical protein